MGKYMRRKCGGAAGGGEAAPAAVVLGGGVRTRSRSAAAVGTVAVAGCSAGKRKRRAEATTAEAEGSRCYLHLRSRRLFMPAVAAVTQRGDPGAEEASTSRVADSGASVEAIAVETSRCSSAASSTVDVAAGDRRSGGDTEACESRGGVKSSVSDSGRDGRERRETTPSSQPPVDYISDLESSQATDEHRQKRCRRTPATTTTSTAAFHLQSRGRMPAAAEIEEFFAAAEKAQAQRFAAKYNFDVALGVPLNAGRFEWTPVATV